MEKIRKIFVPTYIVFLVVVAVFIKVNLKNNQVPVTKKEKQEKAAEIKPAKVYLNINDGKSITQYKTLLQNQDTVIELIDAARAENALSYERTAYAYGTEIDTINGQTAPEGYKWKVFSNNKNITYEVEAINLEDGAVYDIRLEKM